MITIGKNPVSIIIIYAVLLHISWSVIGYLDPSSYGATALSGLYEIFGKYTSMGCFLVAGLAIIGLWIKPSLGGLSAMLPQQAFLMISAFGAAHAIGVGHFSDGTVRAAAFIAADQMPAIIAAIGHTIAIVQRAVHVP